MPLLVGTRIWQRKISIPRTYPYVMAEQYVPCKRWRKDGQDMSDDSMVSRSGGDTENYQAHRERKNDVDPSTSPRGLMKDAIVADAPAPPVEDQAATVPVIPSEVV